MAKQKWLAHITWQGRFDSPEIKVNGNFGWALRKFKDKTDASGIRKALKVRRQYPSPAARKRFKRYAAQWRTEQARMMEAKQKRQHKQKRKNHYGNIKSS